MSRAFRRAPKSGMVGSDRVPPRRENGRGRGAHRLDGEHMPSVPRATPESFTTCKIDDHGQHGFPVHADAVLCSRTKKNGSRCFLYCCRSCGWQSQELPGDTIGHEEAENIPDFASVYSNEAWWERYDDYLNTPEWRHRHDLVMARAGGICECCLELRATQVHHTNYDSVGDEILWDLRAVCDSCHDRFPSRRRALREVPS